MQKKCMLMILIFRMNYLLQIFGGEGGFLNMSAEPRYPHELKLEMVWQRDKIINRTNGCKLCMFLRN
jgi:hypothetical protein